ncbi:MAG TPA: tRNA 2-thiouridine(34) synthase MnmA [Gemmatales bacterium]|nr:tRNA 2-thiouridine(34) synthase MnmA [Gemmatales bacterium]
MKRIVVAMSGGVDSSVAALLLKQQGYEVLGVFLRTGVAETQRKDQRHRGCCSALDARDARSVADALGIPCYSLDFAEDFQQVMQYFADEYVHGRTPNPCVKCNSEIKFGRLWQLALSLEADGLATGHYARRIYHENRCTLQRARDLNKDQTYVLFGIQAEILPKLYFPLGDLMKTEVRELARHAGLPVADKAESQDICFVPDGNAAAFVAQQRPEAFKPGLLVDTTGKILGKHSGIGQFTVGQRKGLGLDRSTLKGQRRFVLDIVPDEAKVVLGTAEEGVISRLVATEVNWLINCQANDRCLVKWSHRGELQPARIVSCAEQCFEVLLDKPVTGVARGQALVLYLDDIVLGGGWISSTSP